MNILKNIFSIGQKGNSKVIYFCGIRIKKRLKINETAQLLPLLYKVQRKLSMVNDIWQFDDVKFYVPYYPLDLIQSHIVEQNSFFEEDILKELDSYIPRGAVVLDCGANIGNHTVYWLKKSSQNISKVYCFEPIKSTFEILSKNIELNGLQSKTVLYNIGLNDKDTSGIIAKYNRENIGATSLKEGKGEIELKRLDDVVLGEKTIDFMKIDVEGMECFLLDGAIKILKKHKPLIFIESFSENYEKMHNFLIQNGYELLKVFPRYNYLYQHKDKMGIKSDNVIG